MLFLSFKALFVELLPDWWSWCLGERWVRRTLLFEGGTCIIKERIVFRWMMIDVRRREVKVSKAISIMTIAIEVWGRFWMTVRYFLLVKFHLVIIIIDYWLNNHSSLSSSFMRISLSGHQEEADTQSKVASLTEISSVTNYSTFHSNVFSSSLYPWRYAILFVTLKFKGKVEMFCSSVFHHDFDYVSIDKSQIEQISFYYWTTAPQVAGKTQLTVYFEIKSQHWLCMLSLLFFKIKLENNQAVVWSPAS